MILVINYTYILCKVNKTGGMRMKKRMAFFSLACVLFATMGLPGCSQRAARTDAKGLFSWRALSEGHGDALLELAQSQNITEIYQDCSQNSEAELADFLQNLDGAGIAAYWLTGDPSWGRDPEGGEMLRQIRRAAALRDAAGGALQGIVFDVEPYLLPEWEDGADALMQSFVSAARCAHREASRQGMEMILCVPYFYDTKGFGEALEQLIASGCDRVAVMNYYRGKESEHIASEAALAQKHGRGLINIYELKAPGEHGLVEENTYHSEGLDALEENFGSLCADYPELEISLALHDAQALEEVLAGE